MPIGEDTDRRGSARSNRNLLWEDTTMEREGGGTIPEFRHQGEDFEYIARYSPDFEGTETPWVASIHDDSGRYSSVSGHATDLADAQSLAVAYHQNEWQPGTEKDLQNPDNPDYVAEGTEGMWEGIGQVATGAINVATDPLVIAGTAGYYAGKKGLLDKIGRGKKGPPDNPDYRPDDPLR